MCNLEVAVLNAGIINQCSIKLGNMWGRCECFLMGDWSLCMCCMWSADTSWYITFTLISVSIHQMRSARPSKVSLDHIVYVLNIRSLCQYIFISITFSIHGYWRKINALLSQFCEHVDSKDHLKALPRKRHYLA